MYQEYVNAIRKKSALQERIALLNGQRDALGEQIISLNARLDEATCDVDEKRAQFEVEIAESSTDAMVEKMMTQPEEKEG